MGEPLHVLVYGSVDEGVCDSVRLGVYRDLLAAHDVEMRTWGEFNEYAIQIPVDYLGRLDDALRDGVAKVDLSPIEWADVLVFRRWYGTVHACDDCDFAAPDEASLTVHCRAAGHAPVERDRIIRSLLTSIEKDRTVLRGRAMAYELDDDLLAAEPWVGFYHRLQGDRDLIERFARAADLVTVTTPTLARSMGRYNSAVRVVRNAINTEWYGQVPETDRPLSFMYYGVAPRLRDYAICRDAVDEVARATGGRRIWLGSDDPSVRAVVDQALPYVPEVRDFAAQLAAARPAIGLAPVGQDSFSRAHSELHWLEYSLAGAATVASRTMGGGPYDVIRDGVDGLLARNKAEWRDNLRRLAASPQLRQDLAGHARERVLADYDVRKRAAEWADAFRWAAEHAGRGGLNMTGRGLTPAQLKERELAIEKRAGVDLANRRLARARLADPTPPPISDAELGATRRITDLLGAHTGETAYIVGKGPSLLNLTEEMLGPGPIIAINQAVLHVRGFKQPIYSIQKDGCRLYGARHPGQPCLNGGGDMVPPEPPEILLVSARESADCFADYSPRYLFDVERDFAVPWYTPSAPIAVGIALLMGCARIVFVCHDAYANSDPRAVADGRAVDGPGEAYVAIGRMADELCKAAGIPAEWMTP